MKKTEEFSIGDTVSVTGQENPEHNINFGTVQATAWIDDLSAEQIKESRREGIATLPDEMGFTGAVYMLKELSMVWIPESDLTLKFAHSDFQVGGLDKALIRGYLIGRLGRPLNQVEQMHISRGESWHYLVDKFPELKDFMGLMGLSEDASSVDLMWDFFKSRLLGDDPGFVTNGLLASPVGIGLSINELRLANNLLGALYRESKNENEVEAGYLKPPLVKPDLMHRDYPLLCSFLNGWGPLTAERRAWDYLWELLCRPVKVVTDEGLLSIRRLLSHKEAELAMGFEIDLSTAKDDERLSSVQKIDKAFELKRAEDELYKMAVRITSRNNSHS